MAVKITLSANAGISVETGTEKIIVDALHEQRASVFSPLSPEMIDKIFLHESFTNPDAMVFTHCHDDHFSERLVAEFKREYPSAKLFLPESRFMDQVVLRAKTHTFFVGDTELYFMKLIHEGKEFYEVPHYGLVMKVNGANIFVSGDCMVANPDLQEALGGRQIDLAILDFPWVTLNKGRKYIKETLKPKRLLVNHIPFAHEDVQGFRGAVEKAVEEFSFDTRMLRDPFESTVYEF